MDQRTAEPPEQTEHAEPLIFCSKNNNEIKLKLKIP